MLKHVHVRAETCCDGPICCLHNSSDHFFEDQEGAESEDSHEVDADCDSSTTPPRKHKRHTCIFCKSHSKIFPWATKLRRGRSFAFRMRCGRDINVGQGGQKDLRRHEQTVVHSWAEKSSIGAKPLSSCFGPIRGKAVVEAEIQFGYFIGEHHLAFRAADHASKLLLLCSLTQRLQKRFRMWWYQGKCHIEGCGTGCMEKHSNSTWRNKVH